LRAGGQLSRTGLLPAATVEQSGVDVKVTVDVDGLRPGDVDRLRRRSCTACGGEPAAPGSVHRLRGGASKQP
jgi:hypothetical protein